MSANVIVAMDQVNSRIYNMYYKDSLIYDHQRSLKEAE